jgi:hypothetical protein
MEPTAVVIVGCSRFPRHEQFRNEAQNRSFRASSSALRRYFLSAGVPRSLVLRISVAATAQEAKRKILSFCEQTKKLTATERPVNLILCFIGHGYVSFNDSFRFVLSCSEPNSETTTLGLLELFEAVRQAVWSGQRNMRIMGIIDACYSGFAALEFERKLEAPCPQASDGLARRGLALLCSASSQFQSKSTCRNGFTQFTGALLEALEKPDDATRLSLRQVERRVTDSLERQYENNEMVRPVLRTILAVDGDVADAAIFGKGKSVPVRLRTRSWLTMFRSAVAPVIRTPLRRVSVALALVMLLSLPWLKSFFPEGLDASDTPVTPVLARPEYDDSELPSSAKLLLEPTIDLSQLQLVICNRCSFPVEVLFVNCTVLAKKSKKLPDSAWKTLTPNRQFALSAPALKATPVRKPFNETSGSGWYLLFARPKEPSDMPWQPLHVWPPPDDESRAIPLFQELSTSLILSHVGRDLILELKHNASETDCLPAA